MAEETEQDRHAHERQLHVAYKPDGHRWLVRHPRDEGDETLSEHATRDAWAVRHAVEHGEKVVAVHGLKGGLLYQRPVR